MKKWQKSWLLLMAFSLAIGWIAQGEATVIRIGGPSVEITHAQPVQVIVVNSHGNTFEQRGYYDPSVGGVDIDTSWAGPNASIYIPALGINYIWYNGYWADEEGYYWNGNRRVYIADPQWRERWTTYWRGHRHDGWRGREGWHNRGGEGRHGDRSGTSGTMHSGHFERGRAGSMSDDSPRRNR